MKKYAIIGMLLLLFAPLAIFAQDPVPPSTPLEWLGRVSEMFSSFWGLVYTVILFTPVVIGGLNLVDAKKWVKYVVPVGLSAVVTLLAKFLPIGYLQEALWWWVLVTFLGVVGAQVIGYAALKPFMDSIAEKFNPWKPKEPTQ